MSTIIIDILNPKAAKLIEDLAALNLIAIQKDPKRGFVQILKKFRSKAGDVLSLEEITREVERVRSRRNEK